MNHVCLNGRVIKNAIITGEGRVLKFLLSCKHRYKKKNVVTEIETIVPCIVFDPPTELKESLDAKSTAYISCTGRISRSSYEKPDGDKHYSTDIVLDPVSIILRKQ